MTGDLNHQVFCLPDLGEGLTEAEIIDWKVAVGDTVAIDQIIVEVETAKAAVEVPVPYAGTVITLHAEAGTTLDVGAPLISITAQPPQGAASPTTGPPDKKHDTAADRYREEEQGGSGNVLIGYGTGHGPTVRRRRRGATASPQITPDVVGTESGKAPLVISPLVRKLARDNGLDLTTLPAPGPHGILRRRDVQRAIANLAVTVSPPQPSAAPHAERIPLRGIRRAVADKLSRSRTEIPDATTWVDVDATGLLETKSTLQAANPDLGIGLLAVLARICVAALKRFPELNCTVDTAAGEIIRYQHINLGFAAQTDRGLVVPVVRNAHLMTMAQIAAELTRLTNLAREGTLPPEVLTGGTFTLNNYGVFGVDGSTPIINHPEAALLGIGRIIDKPWAVNGALAVRKVTQLSLTFDHRVCDGGAAGGFLRYVADCVEQPAVLLADM